jgi:ATP-dependent Lon protease
MEKIYLNSYTDDEKKEIFKRHLLRRAINKTGVKDDQFNLNPNVVQALIHDYSLGEPGVRRLEKNIEKILERVAYKIVEENEPLPISIDKTNLRDYLGNSYYNLKDHHSIGVGLAISLGGGDYGSRLTYIESFKKSFANKKEPKRGVMFTGSLGDVFKEAMNISYTYARNFLFSELANKFLYENEVHIHAPDGASKKDGSTDSLTIAASLVSLGINLLT